MVITGGEVGLYENICELIEYACSKNFIVRLLTNVTCFSEEDIYRLANAGLYDVNISIYGLPDFHDDFVGKSGSFKKSINTLKKFKKIGNIGTASCLNI